MKTFFSVFVMAFAVIHNSYGQSAPLYRGTLVDAHSQVRCDIDPVEVGEIINSRNINYVLLSASGCNKKEKFFSDVVTQYKNLAKVVVENKKIFGLAGMKNFSNAGVWRFSEAEKSWEVAEEAGFKGLAEILIQHAVWDGQDSRLKFAGLQMNLADKGLEKVIEFSGQKKFPVILHIELNDSADKREETVRKLEELLVKYDSQSFVLIHLGQASPKIAKELLAKYKNIFFLTSMASGFYQIFTRGKEVHHQDGWETFFEVEGKNMQQHASNPFWRNEWRQLVLDYPDKFILGFDNVFAGNWRNRYKVDIAIWRRGLARLEPNVAKQLACSNAKKLWGLPITCSK